MHGLRRVIGGETKGYYAEHIIMPVDENFGGPSPEMYPGRVISIFFVKRHETHGYM